MTALPKAHIRNRLLRSLARHCKFSEKSMSMIDDIIGNLPRHEKGRGRDELRQLRKKGLVAEEPKRGRRWVYLTPVGRQVACSI